MKDKMTLAEELQKQIVIVIQLLQDKITDGNKMTDGDLPKKAQELVEEWLNLYSDKLQKMWDSQKIEKLPPL